ncbi:MAG: cytochrome-c peroxidase [Tenacibaculum sp.]
MKKLIKLVVCAYVFVSCNEDEPYIPVSIHDVTLNRLIKERAVNNDKNYFILPASTSFSKIPQDPKNPITKEKVLLGKLLFHETALAINPKHSDGLETYSCASCHHAKAGFQSCKEQAIGDGGIGFGFSGEQRKLAANYTEDMVDVQPIKSPSILNGAYQKVMLWNGQFGATGMNTGTEAQWTIDTPKATNNLGFEGLETQAIAGLTVHRLDVSTNLIENLGYKALFDKAFPTINEEQRYSIKNAGLAIAAYERTVLANEAPFQKWLKGNPKAMTDDEKKGAILFFDKAKCYQCHTGASLNSMDFVALGMKDLSGVNILGNPVDEATKKGRGGFTKNPDDDYKFKVPQLYSIKYNGFYGHGSSFKSIKEIIAYKNKGIKENNEVPNSKLDARFTPLNLSEEEIDLLTLFVEKSLDDKNLKRYVPERVLSDNCIPNNDTQSQEDICN